MVSETAAVIDPDSPLTRAGLYNLDPSRKGFGYGVDGAMTRFVRSAVLEGEESPAAPDPGR